MARDVNKLYSAENMWSFLLGILNFSRFIVITTTRKINVFVTNSETDFILGRVSAICEISGTSSVEYHYCIQRQQHYKILKIKFPRIKNYEFLLG